MRNFKERWEIQKNWQLIFPALGVLVLLYSSYKLTGLFIDRTDYSKILLLIIITSTIYYILLKIILYLFTKLENKWVVTYKWEMIRIFLVFAFTGTSSLFVGRPLMTLIGITKENLNAALYWVLFIIIGLIFYQILLVCFGWLFGQFRFFWNFEKKMLNKLGFKRFFNE